MAFCDVPRRNSSMELNGISGTFGILVILVVSLRMVTRMSPFSVAFGWDDGLILAAAVGVSTYFTKTSSLTFGRRSQFIHHLIRFSVCGDGERIFARGTRLTTRNSDALRLCEGYFHHPTR